MFSQTRWNAAASEVGLCACNAAVFEAVMPYFDTVQPMFYTDFEGYATTCEAISAKADVSPELTQLYYMVALGYGYLHDTSSAIPQNIRYDTLRDMAIWVENYHQQTGKLGLGEYRWIRHHLQGKLFRLGRLQFVISDNPWRADWPPIDHSVALPGAKAFVLHVHIPQGERLGYADSQESYNLARQFFLKHFDRSVAAFACSSWLLHPNLRHILAPESNIIRFQSDYTICCCDEDERQTLERVFGTSWKRGMPFPQFTSLQKAIADYIANGGRLGNGYGIRTP